MQSWGFCGPTYQSISPNIDAEFAMNLYCERSESSGAKVPIGMLRTPGKKVAFALPEVAIPGQFTVNNRAFAAASNFWELGLAGGPVNRGSLGATPTAPTQIIANETQLLILNNGNLYVFTLATNVLTAVNMGQFNGPVLQIDFSDGYGLATLRNSHTFQQSNLEDFTTWDGLNISTVSLFPDNITSMICDHRELWLFSGKKTAVYYNAGAGFPVFIPIQGAFLEDGAAAAFATVRADNSIFWLALDERGTAVAKRANGYTGQRVSTHATEFAWQQYTTVSDAVAYTYQENGHTFWVIRFPTANATWVYDIATGYWHQRGFWQAGKFTADRSTSHMIFNGKHLVGDWATGNIYEQSMSLLDDAGSPIRFVRRTPTISKENQWLYFPELEIDVQTGNSPVLKNADGTVRDPELLLRWSNNGTATWSNTYTLKCGRTGNYGRRVRKTQLGRARRRVWEISGTDPILWAFPDAYLRVEPEAA